MTSELDRAERDLDRPTFVWKHDMFAMLNETGLGYEFSLEALFDKIELLEAGR